MKTNIYLKSVMAIALTASLSACDENAWNDDLKGFKEKDDEPIEQVESVEYTMTDADYATVSTASENVAMAGDELKNALAAVKTNKAFSTQIPAQEYAPAFLASKYYYLNDGSSVQLTYNERQNLPAVLNDAMAANAYTVDEVDYQEVVWESETDYVESFSPSKPASRYISRILSENVTAENPYCVVTYNVSNQDPVFGGSSKPVEWEMSSTIGSATLNAAISCKGVITAVCAQGYMVTDKSGSILVYMGREFDSSSVAVGQQVEIDGTVGSYNTGLQITGSSASVTVVGEQAVTYPAPKAMSQGDIETFAARTGNHLGIYASIKGTVKVNGYNINIILDPDATDMGSIYQATADQKDKLVDGSQVTVEGYAISVSQKAPNRFVNFVVTKVNGVAVKAARHASRAASVKVPSEVEKALYVFSNGAWAPAADFSVLNPADYKAMGQTYSNFNSAADARKYLARYLSVNYPYAAADDVENILYEVYNSTEKKNVFMADQYTFNGTEWVLNTGITTVTNQFVKVKGAWIYDPTVHITLAVGRNIPESARYYQACVDWVYENICVPMGDTSIKSGKFYVTSFGNNEYYSGASAYQNNVDLRPSAAREQYAAGYEGMTDEQVVATMKERFIKEVMPGALATLYPDAKPMDGVDLYYEITFGAYTGTTTTYTARFKVVGPGKFEGESCTWDN